MNITMNKRKEKTPATMAVDSQATGYARGKMATLSMESSTQRMAKPRDKRILDGSLEIEVGGLRIGIGLEKRFNRVLHFWKGLWSPAELVLACYADVIPMGGRDPILRLGRFRQDAGNDPVRNFPRKLRVSFLGKQHDLSDREPVGLHGAFLIEFMQAAMHERGATCAVGERLCWKINAQETPGLRPMTETRGVSDT